MMVCFGTTFGAIGLFLCFPRPVWGQGNAMIQVSFAGNNVTLTCPVENGWWWKEKENRKEKISCSTPSCMIADYQGMLHNGLYGCEQYGTNLYLHVKECPGCVEVDIWVATGIILTDLLVTFALLALTYHCSRKWAARFGGGPAAGGSRMQPRGQREDHPPPVPNPDYEPIRKGQREVYAGLEPRPF
ncbi:T-cell surface glycoprotein CD3 epsilon chain isoform X2 [Paroedura picta]|uniref:T-cell surface glycoprotein CD3 epsilon chain isoform X2 n=1 Tax=Paroedura picta TaxID=143630 RepID=UPI0040577F07